MDKITAVKTFSSIVIIMSMIFTAANIYPLNLLIAIPATLGWLWVSFQWRDKSLISMNIVGLTIYMLGITNYLHSTGTV